jgi:hypothetical protein
VNVPVLKQIGIGALSGFLSAFVVDVHAWSTSDEPFNWLKAVKRWVSGAITGAVTATGIKLVAG